MSKTLIGVVIAVLIVAAVGAFAFLTYPKTVVGFQVSFTIGADVKSREFNVPFLHGRVQVEVVVNSGTSLWTARIAGQNKTFWNHSTSQGGQTTYKSEWIELSDGPYTLTFATAGLGSLEAEIKVTSKGGFW
jgi:hypothetical protein